MSDNFYMDDFFSDSVSEEIILLVKKLTVQCPETEPLANCPFTALRELPLAEKLAMVDKMSLEQLEGFISHHENCLQTRLVSESSD